jgi:hypothetical protein
MKKLIFTLFICLSFSSINAQEIMLKKGEKAKEFIKGAYYKSEKKIRDKFEGIWEYKTAKETFRILIFNKKTYVKNLDIYVDILEGRYCYSVGISDCDLNTEESHLYSRSSENNLENGLLLLKFSDKEFNKSGLASLEILENGTAHWVLKNIGALLINGKHADGSEWIEGFSVPTNVILTKVK